MTEGRIVIIAFLHGKLDAHGNLIEPDIDVIFEKWLQRHPQFRGRKFHTIRGRMTLMTDDDSIDAGGKCVACHLCSRLGGRTENGRSKNNCRNQEAGRQDHR